MQNEEQRRVRFVVTGRVQGVGFRAHTEAAATQLGLTGFVCNRPDGAVLGEAEGPVRQIAKFVAWLHRGSPWSRVQRVDVADLETTGEAAPFEVRRDPPA